MPYRPTNDGRFVSVRAENRPRRGVACPPSGCARGVGAVEPRAEASFAPPATMNQGPALSRADAVALASGARISDRAARYAIAVVNGRGLAGVGMGRSSGTPFWKVESVEGSEVVFGQFIEGFFTDDDTGKRVVMLAGAYRPEVGDEFEDGQFNRDIYDSPDWVYVGTQGGRTPTSSGSSGGSFGGGFLESAFGRPQAGQSMIGNVGQQAYGAYAMLSGKGPATPAPRPAATSSGPSVGAILGVLGVVSVVGLGVAFAMSRGVPAAVVKANARRRSNRARRGHRSSRPSHRKSRYFVQRAA